MDLCDLAPEYIRAIAPYQPGKPLSELERELGISNAVKLASNENPLGPSPLALEAIKAALPDIALYPDGNGFELKKALSQKLGVAQGQIVLGNGSNDVLEFMARAFLRKGASAIFAQHAFAVYPLVTQATGATGIEVPAREFGHDLDAMLAAVRDDTKIVFIANPNNPTGTLLSAAAIEDFLKRLPAHVLAVLDEAYVEYLPDGLRIDSVAWLARFPNLVITRTFSKAYGLAGLRVGFALAHPSVADMMNRVRQPFNVNSLAQVAATAALGDADFIGKSFRLNQDGMRQLTDGFKRLGIAYIPSYGNFVSFRIGNATAMYQSLLKQGVIVRPVANYAMPEYLRVSVGLESENKKFLDVLEAGLQGAQQAD
jgi:histidinol-phosphate aminotransferase